MTHKFIFLLPLLLLINTSVVSQSYNEHVLEATKLHAKKEYKKSALRWQKAFDIHTGYASDYYNAACAFSLAGLGPQGLLHLKEAIRNGWTDIAWLKKDSDLLPLKQLDQWNSFTESIPVLQEEYRNSIDTPLKEALEKLRVQDQSIRQLLPDAEKRFGRDSYHYSWFRNELMPRNDSIVLTKLKHILQKNGWPGINKVGELANQTLWLVIQHAPLEDQEKYLPLLEKSVAKGESKARYLAFLQDRILMRKGEQQRYGTQSLWDPMKKKNVIYPISNHEGVNKRRAAVGLNTIEEYAKENNFLYEPKMAKTLKR
ncbi:DUF6624 domain-containing protein [Spongiimicrobium salis]|uniref:DUF6624 domain-containing protein n=1 Tax=Spongiimicrobium salis TaxID=1667022 RepID=UPI00374DE4F6